MMSLIKFFLLIFCALVAWVTLAPRSKMSPAPQPPSAPSPVSPVVRSLSVGDTVIVEVIGNTRVFLATTDAVYDEMLAAQNTNSWPLMTRLIDRGSVINPANGVRGVLVKQALFSKFVRITEGEFTGQEGWVQAGLVKRP